MNNKKPSTHKSNYLFIAYVALLSVPAFSHAQLATGTPGRFGQFVQGVSVLINNFLIPALVALCVLLFIWGVYTYFIVGSADEQKRSEGRQFMLYALLGFVAIVTLWAIVLFLAQGFGFDPGQGSLPLPTVGEGVDGGGSSFSDTGSIGGLPLAE